MNDALKSQLAWDGTSISWELFVLFPSWIDRGYVEQKCEELFYLDDEGILNGASLCMTDVKLTIDDFESVEPTLQNMSKKYLRFGATMLWASFCGGFEFSDFLQDDFHAKVFWLSSTEYSCFAHCMDFPNGPWNEIVEKFQKEINNEISIS